MMNYLLTDESRDLLDPLNLEQPILKPDAATKPKTAPVVIAIDGTSASGKSTNAKLVAKALGFVYVDTGAMYRTLGWYCLKNGIDVHDARAVSAVVRKWKTSLECVESHGLRSLHFLVDGYYPGKELRSAETSSATSLIAAVPKVRDWMKKAQRDCIKFGSLVMEGRDIGTNVFPETDFKFYLDACLKERSMRREAEGVQENLAARDQRDSQRSAAPLMIALGALIVNNSGQTPEQTSGIIIAEFHKRSAAPR
ncbi:MAG: 3-phosphoshikimate 1-carboxyvinyltransferase [Verrucomicrobiales bacterium]|nr:3-phosphoshikimate 1-carboxyvinyltransferase [Verrucomicrobiales bacterium]